MKKPLVLVALSFAVACGSSNKGERGTLTMAAILPKTGTFANQYTAFSGGLALAQKMINDAGGILGNDVVFLERDEAAGTNGTVPITDVCNELVELGVQVWIGPQVSDSAIAAGKIAGDNQRLLFAPNAGASGFSTIDDHDFAFRGVQLTSQQGRAAAVLSYDAGHRTAAVLHLNNAVSTDIGNIFASSFTAAGGTVLTNHGYNFDTANPGSFVPQDHLDAVFAGNPDVVFLYGALTDAVALLTTWDKGDWNGQLVLGAVFTGADLAASVGPAKLAGALVYAQAAIDPADFAIISAAFADLNGFAIDDTNSNLTIALVQSALLGALAIEKAGVDDGTAARDVVRELTNEPGEQVKVVLDYEHARDIVRRGDDLDYLTLNAPFELDANGDFLGNTSERLYKADGTIEVLRVLVPGVDF